MAAWANALMLAVALAGRGYYKPDDRLKTKLPRILLSGLLMGGVLLGGTRLLAANFQETAHFMASLWALAVLVAGGIFAYFALAHVTGAMTLSELKAAVKR